MEQLTSQRSAKTAIGRAAIRIDDKSAYSVKPDQDGLIKKTIAIFECRGIQIVEVQIGNLLSVKVVDGPTVFESVDLTQKLNKFRDIWCEYDQATGNVAQVQDAKFELKYSN